MHENTSKSNIYVKIILHLLHLLKSNYFRHEKSNSNSNIRICYFFLYYIYQKFRSFLISDKSLQRRPYFLTLQFFDCFCLVLSEISGSEIFYSQCNEAPQRGARNPAFTQVYRKNHAQNCLKFMLTPSLPNHAGYQIDISRNNAICSSNSHHTLTLGGPCNFSLPKGPFIKNVRLKPGFLDPPPTCVQIKQQNHTRITIEHPDSADPPPPGLAEHPL